MLKVENISCQKGYNLLFENLSFYLKAGDIARISGLNGTGKTSLLKILAGISSFSGKISLNGSVISSDKYKQQILYLGHQSLINKQLTVMENLTFLTNLIGDNNSNYTEVLEFVGLKNYQNELCYKLSAGQKRRIILATLFLTKTKLWLLDEPFTALDVKMVAIIENKIKEFCDAGGICIFTTHQDTTLTTREISL